jgi:hypothetical protein
VDFAYWTRADGTAMLGLPVYSALDGRVAGLIQDRLPYGNAVIIETPLNKLPAAWLDRLPTGAYDPAAPLQPSIGLTCPAYDYTPRAAPLSLSALRAFENFPVARDETVSAATIGQGPMVARQPHRTRDAHRAIRHVTHPWLIANDAIAESALLPLA